MAGYSEQQILGLGDLAKLSYDNMDDLIVKKGLSVFGEEFSRQGRKVTSLHKADDKEQ